VEEDNITLAKTQNDRIEEFVNFGEPKNVLPELERAIFGESVSRIAKDHFNVPPRIVKGLDSSICEANEANNGDGEHVEVVDEGKEANFKLLA